MTTPKPIRSSSSIPRREFLHRGALAAGAASVLSPSILANLFATSPSETDRLGRDRILVLIELAGGNDGLSTVVPFSDPAYHTARRVTHHDAKSVLRLDERVGFHPNLKHLKRRFDAGQLAVVQGCAARRPSRSHFESMDIWHAADPSGRRTTTGWLGRYADLSLTDHDAPELMVALGTTPPLALRGDTKRPITLSSPSSYRFIARREQRDEYHALHDDSKSTATSANDALAYVRRVAGRAERSSKALRGAVSSYRPRVRYSGFPIANDLRMTAAIIAGRLPTRVIHVQMTGYDTHVGQRGRHDFLMRRLDQSLGTFLLDLEKNGHADRVSCLVYSEFGRRVRENASGGTDHGLAGPMMLVGPNVNGGLHGEHPSLTDLENGDLKMTTDYRSVYAAILSQWMRGDVKSVLGDDVRSLEKAFKA